MYKVVWRYESAPNPQNRRIPRTPVERHLDPRHPIFSGLPVPERSRALLARPSYVFGEPTRWSEEFRRMPDAFRSDPSRDLSKYVQTFVGSLPAARMLRNRLKHEQGVVSAEVQGRPVLFHSRGAMPRSRPFNATGGIEQKYLDPAELNGIDARHAWTIPGGAGNLVQIADIELDWNYQHHDLQSRLDAVPFRGLVTDDEEDRDHGTAVLGVLGGDPNGMGITGVAYDAVITTASPFTGFPQQEWNVAGLIGDLLDRLRAGDVICVELLFPAREVFENAVGTLPVEAHEAEFAAIEWAVQCGVNVVQAAGNGGFDLDDKQYGGGLTRDSGAIVVGGGASGLGTLGAEPRRWLGGSNYGSRVNLQGWGDCVATTGGTFGPGHKDLTPHETDSNRCYRSNFNGTSSATAMVAGAVACVSGAAQYGGKAPLSPYALRTALIENGRPQAGTAQDTQRIGPLPDLLATLNALGLRP